MRFGIQAGMVALSAVLCTTVSARAESEVPAEMEASAGEAAEREAQERAQEDEERRSEQAELYEEGTSHLDEGDLDEALAAFSRVASAGGKQADGALYWKAYVQNRKGQRAEALATVAELRRAHPKSPWLDDARALEVEMRGSSGQAVAAAPDASEDLKLMALNSLMGSDPERAVPLLEKFLRGNPSPRLQERALFVLSQSGSPRAREIVAEVARSGKNPDIRKKAIRYLGMVGGAESYRLLSDIYKASPDEAQKKAVLQGFMLGGEKARVLEAATSEPDPDVRRYAVQQLGVMGASAELWELYRKETVLEVKKSVLQALFVGGAGDRLLEVARSEKDDTLRRLAVRNLGLISAEKTGAALVSLYGTDAAVREQVIEALFLQQNVKALIAIARAEKDPELKKEAVQKLGLLGSKEATDYILEILEK